jgi:excisionase family DNA binding protein
VTIQEAARQLGIKEDAIRKRIQRGSMRHEKVEDGRVYVWVDAAQDATQDERLEDLREQISYLRRQLDEERDARRRADMILVQLSQSNAEQARMIRELEAPQEATEAAENVVDASEESEPPAATVEAQEGVQRPWRRRVFGS